MSARLRSSLLALSACLGLMACEGSNSEASRSETLPPSSPSAKTSTEPASSLSPTGQPLEQALSCREERGPKQAQALVEICLAVSPATRPPCNVENTCETIQGEIDRGCDFFKDDEKPAECTA